MSGMSIDMEVFITAFARRTPISIAVAGPEYLLNFERRPWPTRKPTANSSNPTITSNDLTVLLMMTHNRILPTRSSKDHDFMAVARRVVEQAIGKKLDGSPLEESKNPHAVALGRLGGAKGGAARAVALSPGKRSAIAKKAAKARWSKES